MADKRNWVTIGLAALAGALIAFPAGMMMSRQGTDTVISGSAAPAGALSNRPGRNPYSAGVLNDPYVIEQQLRVVEALERNCRQLRENCQEARLGRLRIEEAARN